MEQDLFTYSKDPEKAPEKKPCLFVISHLAFDQGNSSIDHLHKKTKKQKQKGKKRHLTLQVYDGFWVRILSDSHSCSWDLLQLSGLGKTQVQVNGLEMETKQHFNYLNFECCCVDNNCVITTATPKSPVHCSHTSYGSRGADVQRLMRSNFPRATCNKAKEKKTVENKLYDRTK